MDLSYDLLGGTVTFNENVKKYGTIKQKYDKYYEELLILVSDFYVENKEYICSMYPEEDRNLDYIFRLQQTIFIKVKEIFESELSLYVKNGIYDITEDDYLENNYGLLQILDVNEKLYSVKRDLYDEMNRMWRDGINQAHYDAYSQVKGNQYGIITNSIIANLAYNIENDYRIRKSTERADQQYYSESERIAKQADDWFETKWIELLQVYLEKIDAILRNIVDGLLQQTIKNHIKAGLLEQEVEDSVNLEKSNSILQNSELVDDSRNVILKALEADPFNETIYVKILDKKYLDDGVIKLARDLSMGDLIILTLTHEINEMKSSNQNTNIDTEKVRYLSMLQDKSEAEIYQSIFIREIDTIKEQYKMWSQFVTTPKVMDGWLRNNISQDTLGILKTSIDDIKKVVHNEINKIISQETFDKFVSIGILSAESIRLIGSTATELKIINAEIEKRAINYIILYMKKAVEIKKKCDAAYAKFNAIVKSKTNAIEEKKGELKDVGMLSFSKKKELKSIISDMEMELSNFISKNEPKGIKQTFEKMYG